MFCKAIRNVLIINEVTICKQRAKYKYPKSVIQVYYKHREAKDKRVKNTVKGEGQQQKTAFVGT